MAEVMKRCAVEPIQLSETLTAEVDVNGGCDSSSRSRGRCCMVRLVGWFSSMSFDDRRLELMYDRYVMKFSEYRVNMLMLLLSISCLTELIFYFVVGATSNHIIITVLLMSLLVILVLTQVYLLDLLHSP